jgi:hypothetical protein
MICLYSKPRKLVRAAFQDGDVGERWRLRKSRAILGAGSGMYDALNTACFPNTLCIPSPVGKAETLWTSPGFSVIHESSQTWPWCYPRSTKEIVLPRIILPLCENCWGTSISLSLSSRYDETYPCSYCPSWLERPIANSNHQTLTRARSQCRMCL